MSQATPALLQRVVARAALTIRMARAELLTSAEAAVVTVMPVRLISVPGLEAVAL
jgi:hypothetical protein